MNSWQAGQDGRAGEKTEDRRQNLEEGFPMNLDVRFTATSLRHRLPPILLDVYYTSKTVGCQVNFNHRFHRFSQIFLRQRTEGDINHTVSRI